MKYWKLATFASALLNIVLLAFFLNKSSKCSKLKNNQIINVESSHDYSYNNPDNFRKVFIEKNDSAYKLMYNYTFENHPEDAFLVSSTYYLLTGDCKAFENIKVANSQLESVYQTFPKINESLVSKCK